MEGWLGGRPQSIDLTQKKRRPIDQRSGERKMIIDSQDNKNNRPNSRRPAREADEITRIGAAFVSAERKKTRRGAVKPGNNNHCLFGNQSPSSTN